jgi:integrase
MDQNTSISELLPAYSTWLVLQGRKPSTVRAHNLTIKRLIDRGVVFAPQTNLQDFLALQLTNKASTSHVNNYIGCVRVFARFLKEKGIVVDESLLTFSMMKDRYRARATLSDSEIEAFLDIPCPTQTMKHWRSGKTVHRTTDPKTWDKWDMFWKIAAFSGMRTGEVAHLTVNDVDFGRGIFTIQDSKTNTPRMVPISSPIQDALEVYIKSLQGPYLFPSRQGGNSKADKIAVFDNVDWHSNFHKRINILEIKRTNLTPYSLRHSAATRWLEEDMNIIKVKKILGHSNVKTTEIYTHYTTKDIIEAVERKDRLVLKYKSPQEKLKILREVAEEIGAMKDDNIEVVITSRELTVKIKEEKK